MFSTDQYALLDVGAGRRLERFGALVLDRPAPAANNGAPREPGLWCTADAWYQRQGESSGVWGYQRPIDAAWRIRFGELVLLLRCGEAGAIGVYPEQAANWDWIAARVRGAAQPPRVLNLFGYTGGSTLAAAAAGAHVVHVDAARGAVAWARRNAELSGLQQAPIRWIVEDARKFVQRELRRGARYHGIILDPPTYGHGPKAQPWKFREHFPDLWRAVLQLLHAEPHFILLTCHTPGMGPAELRSLFVGPWFERDGRGVHAQRLLLANAHGQRLASGVAARWSKD